MAAANRAGAISARHKWDGGKQHLDGRQHRQHQSLRRHKLEQRTEWHGRGSYAVWAFDASNVWAVGTSGSVVRRSGGKWQAEVAPSTLGLLGVWAADANTVFAVGEQGTLLRRSANGWIKEQSGTSASLWGVMGSSAAAVWVVGTGGQILEKQQRRLKSVPSGTTNDLFHSRCVAVRCSSLSGWNRDQQIAVASKSASFTARQPPSFGQSRDRSPDRHRCEVARAALRPIQSAPASGLVVAQAGCAAPTLHRSQVVGAHLVADGDFQAVPDSIVGESLRQHHKKRRRCLWSSAYFRRSVPGGRFDAARTAGFANLRNRVLRGVVRG